MISDQERSLWCHDLNPEQTKVFEHYLNGDNVFMTGAGGCGKTYLIRRMYEHAERTGRIMQVCATTGCASILLKCNAKTIHSWAGIGLGTGTADDYVSKIKTNRQKLRTWLSTQTLIIDEISMMSKKMLELLDTIGRLVRKRHNVPFGGIQVIASGDFYQLPPVSKVKNSEEGAFAFETSRWTEIFPVEIELTNNHRQSDPTFVNILNQIRIGRITRSTINTLSEYVGRTPETTEYKPARLLPIKSKVNAINQKELNNIKSEPVVFEYIRKEVPVTPPPTTDDSVHRKEKLPSPTVIKQELDFMLKNSVFEHELTLKVDAQVMCIINYDMDREIVNGSIGKVVAFMTDEEYNQEYKPEKQSLETLTTKKSQLTKYPVVEFMNGVTLIMKPHIWLSEKHGSLSIGLAQIPLILAWAVSIHKSQGMTVDMAEIDIGRSIFECGQSYVALSRVRSLDGLYLTEFNPSKIKVNKKVKEFYQEMAERQAEETSEEEEDDETDTETEPDTLPPVVTQIDMDKFRRMNGYDDSDEEKRKDTGEREEYLY